jgi:hypothetical protein
MSGNAKIIDYDFTVRSASHAHFIFVEGEVTLWVGSKHDGNLSHARLLRGKDHILAELMVNVGS